MLVNFFKGGFMKKGIMLVLVCFTLFRTAFASLSDHAGLAGIYDMEITIGGKVFHDVLNIAEVTEEKDSRGGTFKGTLTVPDVFTAELEKTSFHIFFWGDAAYLNFEITANENGKKFKVKYSAEKSISGNTMTGKASLENDELFGVFVAKRINQES